MNKLFSLLKRVPKRTAAALMVIALAVVIPTALHAYGPSRQTFTGAHPAPFVTFDSITDNPDVGDERNFVRIKDASDTSSYTDNVNVQAGHTYDVMVYYHNDASTSLNASGVGIAHNVSLRMQMAANVATGSTTAVSGFIDSPSATPTEVYDTANLTNQTAGAMDLAFVAGSAKVTSNGTVNGATLPDSLFTTGTHLGYNALDGTLMGCNQYAGYVIFQVTANQPNFTVTKQVRKSGETTWNKTEAVNPTDSLTYLITYKNTGTTEQNNVVIKDVLPNGVTYKPGTTYLVNSNNANGLLLNAASDTLNTTGINIGDYGPGGVAYIQYSAQVTSNSNLTTCGANALTNTATAETANGSKSDIATVTVNKTCTTTPSYACSALTASLVSGTEYKFNGSASATNGASIVNYVFNFGDGKSQTVTNPSNVLHTYATKGASYTANLTVNVNVNGVVQAITGENCTVTITVGSTPECKPGIPVGDSRCTTPQCLPGIPVGDTRCTVTPPLLPHTGPTDNIVAFLGLGALIASVTYYIRSRRLQA